MGAVVMDFVSSCGCDGAYGRDCGFVWVAWFFFFFFLVVDFVADCECGCDWFCGGWQWVDSKEEKEM